MKIIMNNCETSMDAVISFNIVKRAIKEKIQEGRNNFKAYEIQNKVITVCKNKKSYITYVQAKHGG